MTNSLFVYRNETMGISYLSRLTNMVIIVFVNEYVGIRDISYPPFFTRLRFLYFLSYYVSLFCTILVVLETTNVFQCIPGIVWVIYLK